MNLVTLSPSPIMGGCQGCSSDGCRESWFLLCREEPDETGHLLLRCPALMGTRSRKCLTIHPEPEEVGGPHCGGLGGGRQRRPEPPGYTPPTWSGGSIINNSGKLPPPRRVCRIHSEAGAEIWEPQPHISPQFSIYMEQSVRRQLKSHERPELPGGCRVAIMAPLSRESVEWPKECRAAMNGQPFQSHIVALIRLFPATIGLTC